MEGRAGGARGGDDWVERVRAATDIVELVGQTVALRRVGRNSVGLCPFHQEKTPSFFVNGKRLTGEQTFAAFEVMLSGGASPSSSSAAPGGEAPSQPEEPSGQ